jgi:hypothetical protein
MSEMIARETSLEMHGPGKFYYSLLPDGKPHPVMRCLCGWCAEQIADTWKDAGQSLDQHIAACNRRIAIDIAEQLRPEPGARAKVARA